MNLKNIFLCLLFISFLNAQVENNINRKDNYNLYWFDEKGIKNIALDLLDKIKQDPILKPIAKKSFKLDKLLKSLSSLDKSPERYFSAISKIDFMLTEIFDRYVNYLSKGVVNWKLFRRKLNRLKRAEISAAWERYILKADTKKLLLEATEKNDLNFAIKQVNFTYPNSDKLVEAINHLEKIAKDGGYVKIPKGKTLKIGTKSKTVKLLRKRLLQSNDLTALCKQMPKTEELITNNIDTNSEKTLVKNSKHTSSVQKDCDFIFDADLKDAVKSFQKRHGLNADGVVGAGTIRYLNIPVENRIKKIRLNLERMRWLPRNLGEKYFLINIPDYTLKMYNQGKIQLDMRVIVGNKKHPTPIFSDILSYIVLNPYWKIPTSIATKELIPKLARNPRYLQKKGIRMHASWDPNSEEYDPNSIDWQEYNLYLQNLKKLKQDPNTEDLEYVSLETISLPNFRFIQIPSKGNPLGRMKFMFPNKHSVYMHDTPAKFLFRKAKRAYSHGCIRLAKPRTLLKTISLEDKNLSYDRATEVLKDIEMQTVTLKKKIPVHIVYITSWVDNDGKLQFRDDVYRYDKMQKNLIL